MTGYAFDEEICQSFGSVLDAAKQPPDIGSGGRFERNKPNMVCPLVTHEALVSGRDMKSTSSSIGGREWGIEIKNCVARISPSAVKVRFRQAERS